MIFGTLNLGKIWIDHRTHLSTTPVSVATLPWEIQKGIFNSIVHTCFWLFTLSQKKTNFNLLAHPTWKCHHTNLWNAKLFHPTEGLLCYLWLSKEPVVMCGNWNVMQATSQKVFKVTTFYMDSCLLATDQFHRAPRYDEIQPMWQQAAATTRPRCGLVLDTRAPPVACLRRGTRVMQIIGSTKQQ